MRRIICLLTAAAAGILCIQAAQAETGAVPVRQLPEAVSPEWKQTYEAYGRTIDVDLDIFVPEADTVPVLKVRKAEPVGEPLNSELAEAYAKADRADKDHYYSYETGNYTTIRLDHKFPILYGTSKKKDGNPAVTSEDRDLAEYDADSAYADNNPLTVREAADIIRTHLKEVFPDVEIRLDTVMLYGKTYWRKSGKPVYDRGGYSLTFRQCFRGIPSMACINDTYTDRSHTNLRGSWNTSESGRVFGAVYDEESWFIAGRFYRETGTVLEDVPVIPFGSVKSRVEALIESGHIRRIYSVSLGYVLFDTRDPEEYLLAPCWVAWCEYHPDGPLSEKTYGINDSELMFDGNNAYYRALVFDAQTGEMFDVEDRASERFLYPGYDKANP